ncbi:hypothetical protein GCM10011414_01720 [Croceivirga lutea]|uniref:N-acetylmuramoyl-L-alanine amidase n=1 Tax=Croceivirga lutea TaxID=1775167 RepID=UPI001639F574|nr:N-acetylmuramoyl-L-alanine amidase [Croceivirga lutea]GGG36047.1 hypothetical protein GCM10011414_01720 [Croceivirga lutea]
MRTIFLIFTLLVSGLYTTAQEEMYTVTAAQGDGIFSLLRKEGLDPVKYYGEFLTINKENLKNGSELVLGKQYFIPLVEDSYKNMGVKMDLEKGTETAIFNEELALLNTKSDHLKNAIIYLMLASNSEDEKAELSNLKEEVLRSIAEELMVNGAKVYLLKGNAEDQVSDIGSFEYTSKTEAPMAPIQDMREYVDIINSAYLKNFGKYQRLVVINLDEALDNSIYHKVSIYHDDNSEGKRFAHNLQNILKEKKIATGKDFTKVFAQKNNVYLAKNAMPPLTLLEIENTSNVKAEGRVRVKPNKTWLTNTITSGIFNDYATIELQE